MSSICTVSSLFGVRQSYEIFHLVQEKRSDRWVRFYDGYSTPTLITFSDAGV